MRKISELITINLIIVMVLALLGIYSLKQSPSVTAFKGGEAPIYKGETQGKKISLMCNVYWGTEYIEPYLELFEKENIKITFFLGGTWANDNTELVQKIADGGHEIGNHGYNHKLHSHLSAEQNSSEIKRTGDLIKKITGKDVKLFAPPSGDFNAETLSGAAKLGYCTVMWTADTIDWRDHDSSLIEARVMRNLQPGALVLMHPTEKTLEALPRIIENAKNEGYSFVTVGEQIIKEQNG